MAYISLVPYIVEYVCALRFRMFIGSFPVQWCWRAFFLWLIR